MVRYRKLSLNGSNGTNSSLHIKLRRFFKRPQFTLVIAFIAFCLLTLYLINFAKSKSFFSFLTSQHFQTQSSVEIPTHYVESPETDLPWQPNDELSTSHEIPTVKPTVLIEPTEKTEASTDKSLQFLDDTPVTTSIHSTTEPATVGPTLSMLFRKTQLQQLFNSNASRSGILSSKQDPIIGFDVDLSFSGSSKVSSMVANLTEDIISNLEKRAEMKALSRQDSSSNHTACICRDRISKPCSCCIDIVVKEVEFMSTPFCVNLTYQPRSHAIRAVFSSNSKSLILQNTWKSTSPRPTVEDLEGTTVMGATSTTPADSKPKVIKQQISEISFKRTEPPIICVGSPSLALCAEWSRFDYRAYSETKKTEFSGCINISVYSKRSVIDFYSLGCFACVSTPDPDKYLNPVVS